MKKVINFLKQQRVKIIVYVLLFILGVIGLVIQTGWLVVVAIVLAWIARMIQKAPVVDAENI